MHITSDLLQQSQEILSQGELWISSVMQLDKTECDCVCCEYREKKSETMLYLAGNNYLVSDQRLTDDDIDVLCAALSGNSYITALDLRYNNLTDVGAQHIAKLLSVRVLLLLQ